MKKGLKIALIVTGAFVALTALDLAISFIYNKANEVTVTHELNNSFNKINLDVSTSDVNFIKTNESKGKVICKETKHYKHSVKVEDNTLKIDFEHKYRFNFLMISPTFKVEVYVPATGEYDLDAIHTTGDLKIAAGLSFSNVNLKGSTGDTDINSNVKNTLKVKSSTGKITLSNIKPVSINIETSTGSLSLKDVECSENIEMKSSTGDKYLNNVKAANLTTKSSTGDVKMDSVILSSKLTMSTSTGKIKITNSDANEIDIKTSTGDVSAEFLSSKIVYAKTSTGHVDIPKSTSGGLCSIETSTGGIKVVIK